MNAYESKERGRWLLGIAALVFVLEAVILVTVATEVPEILWLSPVFLALVVLVVQFSSLTIRVTEDEVRWSFGRGWPSRSLALRDVRSVEVSRTPWYWGWGIRWTPHGWLWRCNGVDTVWLELTNGKRAGVGTSNPEALAEAIRRSLDEVWAG